MATSPNFAYPIIMQRPLSFSLKNFSKRCCGESPVQTSKTEEGTPAPKPLAIIGIILLKATLLVVLVRVRHLAIPLERDEGEFAYIAQMLLQGVAPFESAYTLKWPGTHLAYAAIIACFGQTASAIHLGLLLINILTAGFLFYLAKRLFDTLTGAVAATTYLVLTLSPAVLGLHAHATHFVNVFVLSGLCVLLEALERRSAWLLAASGLLFGFAALSKQPALIIAALPILYLLASPREETSSDLHENSAIFKERLLQLLCWCVGFLVPMLSVFLWLLAAGVIQEFWFWTWVYPRIYALSSPLSSIDDFLLSRLSEARGEIPLLCISVLGIILSRRERTKQQLFLWLFFSFTFVAVCAGFIFRPHYFVIWLPAVALFVGITVRQIYTIYSPKLGAVRTAGGLSLLIFFGLSFSLWHHRLLYFNLSPNAAIRVEYPTDYPFGESMDIARYIREHSEKNDQIAVLGSEPQIYFYADRRAATRFIYMYEMMRPHPHKSQMQQEMIAEIETVRPKFLVFVNSPSSWDGWSPTLVEWFANYQSQYEAVGLFELAPDQSRRVWGSAMKEFRGQHPVVVIYRRKV